MTQLALVLPYARTSPLHIPRRDIVLGRGDSLGLRVSIVENDHPSARALVLTGGIGGPRLQMMIAPDSSHRSSWDYGAPTTCAGSVIWAGTGTVNGSLPGTFDIVFPAGTLSGWPRRCRYGLQLDWCDGSEAEMLAEGRLHVAPGVTSSPFSPPLVLTDQSIPVLESDSDPVYA